MPARNAPRKKAARKALKPSAERTMADSTGLRAIMRKRSELVREQAKSVGLIGGPKDALIHGRVSRVLVEAAKKTTGIRSDTELLELALANLALEDDFGHKALKRKGTVSPDLDLEF